MIRRQANHRSRKPYMASRDLGKYKELRDTPVGTVVFASGPYERRRFRTLEEAQDWLDEWDGRPEWGTIYELTWRMIEDS